MENPASIFPRNLAGDSIWKCGKDSTTPYLKVRDMTIEIKQLLKEGKITVHSVMSIWAGSPFGAVEAFKMSPDDENEIETKYSMAVWDMIEILQNLQREDPIAFWNEGIKESAMRNLVPLAEDSALLNRKLERITFTLDKYADYLQKSTELFKQSFIKDDGNKSLIKPAKTGNCYRFRRVIQVAWYSLNRDVERLKKLEEKKQRQLEIKQEQIKNTPISDQQDDSKDAGQQQQNGDAQASTTNTNQSPETTIENPGNGNEAAQVQNQQQQMAFYPPFQYQHHGGMHTPDKNKSDSSRMPPNMFNYHQYGFHGGQGQGQGQFQGHQGGNHFQYQYQYQRRPRIVPPPITIEQVQLEREQAQAQYQAQCNCHQCQGHDQGQDEGQCQDQHENHELPAESDKGQCNCHCHGHCHGHESRNEEGQTGEENGGGVEVQNGQNLKPMESQPFEVSELHRFDHETSYLQEYEEKREEHHHLEIPKTCPASEMDPLPEKTVHMELGSTLDNKNGNNNNENNDETLMKMSIPFSGAKKSDNSNSNSNSTATATATADPTTNQNTDDINNTCAVDSLDDSYSNKEVVVVRSAVSDFAESEFGLMDTEDMEWLTKIKEMGQTGHICADEIEQAEKLKRQSIYMNCIKYRADEIHKDVVLVIGTLRDVEAKWVDPPSRKPKPKLKTKSQQPQPQPQQTQPEKDVNTNASGDDIGVQNETQLGNLDQLELSQLVYALGQFSTALIHGTKHGSGFGTGSGSGEAGTGNASDSERSERSKSLNHHHYLHWNRNQNESKNRLPKLTLEEKQTILDILTTLTNDAVATHKSFKRFSKMVAIDTKFLKELCFSIPMTSTTTTTTTTETTATDQKLTSTSPESAQTTETPQPETEKQQQEHENEQKQVSSPSTCACGKLEEEKMKEWNGKNANLELHEENEEKISNGLSPINFEEIFN